MTGGMIVVSSTGLFQDLCEVWRQSDPDPLTVGPSLPQPLVCVCVCVSLLLQRQSPEVDRLVHAHSATLRVSVIVRVVFHCSAVYVAISVS